MNVEPEIIRLFLSLIALKTHKMATLTLPLTAQPVLSLPALALFHNAKFEWDFEGGEAGEPTFDGAKGVDAVRAKLDGLAAAGPALPTLPSKFDAKTPFAEVSAVLDALDDYLAYR